MCLFWPPGRARARRLPRARRRRRTGARVPRRTDQRAARRAGPRGHDRRRRSACSTTPGRCWSPAACRSELAALRAADARIAAATDGGAPSAALAAGLGQLAVGLAVLAALVTGIPAVTSGRLAAVDLAVIVLTPLAAFEATALLPAAMIQVHRSRAAAARVLALLDARAARPGAGRTTRAGRCRTSSRPTWPAAWPGGPAVVRGPRPRAATRPVRRDRRPVGDRARPRRC